MKNKLLSILALLAVLLIVPVAFAALEDSYVADWKIEVNGDEVDEGVVCSDTNSELCTTSAGVSTTAGDVVARTLSVDEGQTIDIEVTLDAGVDSTGAPVALEDIEVSAKIKGYEYSRDEPMTDSTRLFDVAANSRKSVDLSIDLPRNLEKQVYWLHIEIDTANSGSVERIVKLNVEPTRHGIDIADVTFSPGNTVKAGRSLLTSVLLENYGDNVEEDVKVTVSMPALGITASEYVDEVEVDNSESSANVDYEDVPEMFLPIPANAKEGDYEVVVTASYDRFEEVTEVYTIHVLGNERFSGDDTTLVLAVGPETQNVKAGSTARYAVALTNAGSKSRAYLVNAVAGDWASVSLSDSLVVLSPNQNKVVYVDVATSASAAQGAQTVAVTISADNENLETVSLGAVVLANDAPASGSNVSLRNGLEIALIVLVVILVIIGLIIGFSRLRRDDEGDEDKAYY
jgi:uncharacterized membrane protein